MQAFKFNQSQGAPYIADEVLLTIETEDSGTILVDKSGVQVITLANRLDAEGRVSRLGLSLFLREHPEVMAQVARNEDDSINVNIVTE